MGSSRKEFFVKGLLKWHKNNKRQFPWRCDRSPYKVLIAELMLQRTQAKQVAQIFKNFIDTYPTIGEAAAADPQKVSGILEPLGLRHRIPRIIDILRKIVIEYGGRVPDDYKRLISIRGIGPYIASAVLCFGYGKPVPVVDVNVVRVLSRFFGITPSKRRAHTDPAYWNLSQKLMPKSKGPEFNEALIDFAAIVCTKEPRCEICPFSQACHYFGLHQTSACISKRTNFRV